MSTPIDETLSDGQSASASALDTSASSTPLKGAALTEEQRRKRDEKNAKRRRLAAERRDAADKLARIVNSRITNRPSETRRVSRILYSACESLSAIPLAHKSDRADARRRIIAIQSELLDLASEMDGLESEEGPQQKKKNV
jgi:hypothetical protein